MDPTITKASTGNERLVAACAESQNPVEVCGEGNADAKRPCLGKGQTMLTKPPSQAEFEECWSEAIIKNGLSPSLVDDPLFRKVLVRTARMGQSACAWGRELHLERGTQYVYHMRLWITVSIVTDNIVYVVSF